LSRYHEAELSPQPNLIVKKSKENWQEWQRSYLPTTADETHSEQDFSLLFVSTGLAAQTSNVAVANAVMARSICLHGRLW